VLDTGCAPHDWLDAVVDTDPNTDVGQIGYPDSDTNPDLHGDLVGPLDGAIDPHSGHGTFIAGLIRQACPDADILLWRCVPPDGPLVESDWIASLSQVRDLIALHAAGGGGRAIDVLSLSMGYYHETPQDEQFDGTLYKILEEITELGTIVVCSAGNDSTNRPCYPAAFAPWSDGLGPVQPDPARPPIVSVGALNPNLDTDALFSNAGSWVRAYTPGMAVLSTMPAFQGGGQAEYRREYLGRWRESLDPDDFRGGFGVWSGTSFAAPLLAGRLAADLCDRLPDASTPHDKDAAVQLAWQVVEHRAGIAPS
jgi:subtilisin family serine protease